MSEADLRNNQLLRWFAFGQVGISSKCMAIYLGIGERPKPRDQGHPHDPDDFDRCLALLEAVPSLRHRLPLMAHISPEWKALVENWDRIEASHLEEVGLGWTKASSGPVTYALMRWVINNARKNG